MKSLLVLSHIKVEGANAISGLVYGFPAVTHFLGYVHALSRELKTIPGVGSKVKLGGCGIICHNHQIQTCKAGGGGEQIFSLTRNPLTKKGDTAPFNEEGKVHMEVSLVIECDFTGDDFDFETGDVSKDIEKFTEIVYRLAVVRRLAGGIITGISRVDFYVVSQDEENTKREFQRILFKMLPGFVLRDRSAILAQYLLDNPDFNPFEAMLDFYTLKSKAIAPSEEGTAGSGTVKWKRISKPCGGWIVPIQSGYKAISPIYDGGKVACARDLSIPFCFVEPVYTLGEWMWLHRVRNNMGSIFWRYQYDKGLYVCLNNINNEIEE